MQAANLPARFPTPFASGAGTSYIRAVPTPSQIGITPGAASLTDGFPPLNAQPVGSGGIPPFMQDMNGLLNQITAWTQWYNAGAPIGYDSTFAIAIGGYPIGAFIAAAAGGGAYWLCLTDNNTTNPDKGGAGWSAFQMGGLTLAQIVASNTFQQVSVNPLLYVRADGSDSNNGLTNSPTGAFKTPQAALMAGTSQYAFASSALTIQLGIPGTYPAPNVIPRASGVININGDPDNQGNYILTGNSNVAGNGLVIANGNVTLSGFTINNNGQGIAAFVVAGGSTASLANVTLACPNGSSSAIAYTTGQLQFDTGCILSGNAFAAIWANTGGSSNVNVNTALTLSGNPTFSAATIVASTLSQFEFQGGASMAGSANGPRYLANGYSLISTNGGGPNFIPGSSAGSTNDGQYS